MKLLWVSKINQPAENFRISGFYEKPFDCSGEIVFLYDGMEWGAEKRPDTHFFAVAFGENGGEKRTSSLRIMPREKSLPLPHNWCVEQKGEEIVVDTARYAERETECLSVSVENGETVFKPHVMRHDYYMKTLVYNKNGISVVGDSTEFVRKVYNDAKTYTFQDLEVAIPKKSTKKLACRRKTDNAVLWEFRFTAYLYTQLVEHNGVLYFGTSGCGGHFYGIALRGGTLVADINTHGTEYFSLHEEKIYLVSERGDLLVYNPLKKDLETFEMPDRLRLCAGSEFLIKNNKLYALACNAPKKGAEISEYFAVCIDIS